MSDAEHRVGKGHFLFAGKAKDGSLIEAGYCFSARELGTVLAALRYWQSKLIRDPSFANDLADIATDEGAFEPLTVEEIDALCEEINV